MLRQQSFRVFVLHHDVYNEVSWSKFLFHSPQLYINVVGQTTNAFSVSFFFKVVQE